LKEEEEELPECFGDYTFCDKCNWCPYRDECKLESEEIDEDRGIIKIEQK